MIVAVYARKSTDQSGVSEEQKSVTRQIDQARAYAESKSWVVADEHVYIDDGISGAEFENRPGFLRLLNALKPRPPFQALIMSEESRLGREAIETAYALKQIMTAGVRVFFYLEDRERTLSTPTDKIMLSLTTFADELEREKARQRTSDAMRSRAKRGYVCGGRTFGYRNVDVLGPDGRRSHVTRQILADEADVVRRIFQLCADGLGKCAIAKRLNEAGAPAPRSQQGRPQAWAPSSVREVLYRDLYRGEMTYNRTKKRDAWGKVHQAVRPVEEWMRVPMPDARIVSDELWAAAHARLDLTRQTYLRRTDGKLWGRPANGLAGKYLLTGIARCGICGAGLEVRTRKHGSRRAAYYSCSSYYRRGTTVCPNRYEIPMDDADGIVLEILLDDLLSAARLADVVRRVVEKAQQAQAAPAVTAEELRWRLDESHKKLGRLTAAVAAGGDVPALVAAIKAEDDTRRRLETRLTALAAPAVKFDRVLEHRIRQAVTEWRTVLSQHVTQARQIVMKLIDGRITFAPEERDGRQGYRFRATGTVAKVVAGLVPGSLSALHTVASPSGFEPES